MIFNSSEGCHESKEGDKLLYHWARSAPDNKLSYEEQIDDVCLCDASVNFTNRLAPKECDYSRTGCDYSQDSCKDRRHLTLYFEKTFVLILETEVQSSIWFAVHVRSLTNDSKEVDTSKCENYGDPHTIPSDAIKRAVNNIYVRFCLLNGTFEMIAKSIIDDKNLEEASIEALKDKIREKNRAICKEYFGSTVSGIHLHSYILNIPSLYNYILYLDLSSNSLLKVNSFINHVICMNPTKIKHSIVIFNDHLLWSSMNAEDTCQLYNYLISVPIREALQEELSKEVDKVRRITEDQTIYLTDCDRIMDNNNESESSKKVLELKKFYMTIFRSSNDMTLALLLEEQNMTELLLNCESVLTRDSRLGVIPLASLAQLVGQSFLKNSSSSSGNQQANSSSKSNDALSVSSAGSLVNKKSNQQDMTVAKVSGIAGQKYIMMSKLDLSIVWPFKLDLQRKSNSVLYQSSGNGSKWQRLVKWLIELEPELNQIERASGIRFEEFLAKLPSDSWILVCNSKYRTIYSINKVKNSGLAEAQQSALQLKNAPTNGRL